MRRMSGWVLVSIMILTLGGCAATSTGGALEGVQPPNNSPLATIHPGMSKQQVKALIGSPSAESGHITGKAFIPLYFGNDAHRTSYYYRGMGRVVFADGNVFGGGEPEVIRVEYDPGESGSAR